MLVTCDQWGPNGTPSCMYAERTATGSVVREWSAVLSCEWRSTLLILALSIEPRVAGYMAAEEGYSVGPARIESTTVTPWPKAFDTKNDIFEIGKVATFKRELNAALSTRGMLRYIQEMPLTKELLEIQNPHATQDQILDTLAATQQARHDKLLLAAANLPSLIKLDTLNQMEQDEINLLAADNDAVRLYELIQDYLDLRGGRAQDRVQRRFAELAVKPNDSAAALCKAIDLKWYLFKHHALYSHETQAREGMRMIMRMLLSAPERVAQRAALEITMVDSMALPAGGADAWVGSLLASLERGEQGADPRVGTARRQRHRVDHRDFQRCALRHALRC